MRCSLSRFIYTGHTPPLPPQMAPGQIPLPSVCRTCDASVWLQRHMFVLLVFTCFVGKSSLKWLGKSHSHQCAGHAMPPYDYSVTCFVLFVFHILQSSLVEKWQIPFPPVYRACDASVWLQRHIFVFQKDKTLTKFQDSFETRNTKLSPIFQHLSEA